MKRLRILALSLALLMLIAILPGGMDRAEAASTSHSYWIGVDIVNQRVTIYRTSDNSVAHRWLCSTGRPGHETPVGRYSMPGKSGDERKEWISMSGCKARYAACVTSGVYIHSVLYTSEKNDAVKPDSVLKLGHAATLGNIVVEYAHAKWISVNCAPGTLVIVHNGVNDALITNQLKGDAGTETTESLPLPPSVEKVTINGGDEIQLNVGDKVQLGVTFKPADAESSLTWSSSKEKCAKVNGDGLVTAVADGDAKITVKSSNGKSDTIKIKVYDPTKPTGVSLSWSGSYKKDGDRIVLDKGEHIQLVATLQPSTAVSALSWTSSKTKYGTVNGSGWVTAVAEGDFDVTVKTDREKKTAKLKFRVVDSTKPTGVSLSWSGSYKKDGDRIVLNKGEHIQLIATLSPSTAVSGLSWESSKTKRGTVNGSGWVTAVAEGDFDVTVKTDREKKTAKLKFRVVDSTKPTGVSLSWSGSYQKNGDRIILKLGETIQLKATVSPGTAVTGLSWESSKTKRGTVTSGGLVKAVGEGDFDVTVKTDREKKTAKLKFTVVDQPKSVSIKDSKNIKVGDTLQLRAGISPVGTSSSLSWSSNDTGIATVDGDGKVVAKKKGKVKITVKTSNGKSDTVTIKVSK